MLTLPTHGTTLAGALTAIGQNIRQSSGGYVCLANVHMCMEAYDDPAFAHLLSQAQLVLADGRRVPALAFLVDPHHAQYAGRLTIEEQVRLVRLGVLRLTPYFTRGPIGGMQN